jgi:hypothetical protein
LDEHSLAAVHALVAFAPAQVFVTGLHVLLRHARLAAPSGAQGPRSVGSAAPGRSSGTHVFELRSQYKP